MADYSREQLMKALRKADAAGDTDAAKVIARRIKGMEGLQGPQTEIQPKPERGLMDNVRDGLAAVNQGLSFGFADEIISGVGAPVRAYQEDIGLLEAYRKNQDEQKQNREDFREESPWTATGLEMAGAIPTGIYGAGSALTNTALKGASPLVQASGVGLTEGALYGAGTADEGERASGAMTGGAIGMLAGPVGAKIAEGAGAVAKPALKSIASRVTDNPERQAGRVITRGLLEEFGDADAAVGAYNAGGRRAALVDISDRIKDSAKGALRDPESNARKTVMGVMDRRQEGQQGRLLQAAGDSLGIADARTSRDMLSNVIEERQKQAGPLYEAAYEKTVPVSGKLFDLMDRPALKTAQKGANRLLKEEGIDPQTLFRDQEKVAGGRLAIGDGDSVQGVNVRYIDYLKRALDDQYQSVKNRFPQKARAILRTKQELLEEVDGKVPEYAQARQIFSDAKTLEDAQDLGRNIFSRKEDVFDIEDRVASMTDGEKMMFRSGVMEEVTGKVESAGETQNSVSRLLRTTEMKNRLRQAFDSDEQFEEFVNQAMQEDAFSRTRNYLNVRGGSQTDPLKVAGEAFEDSALGRGALSEALRSQDGFVGTALRVGHALLGNSASDETKEQFVKIVTDANVTEGQLRKMLTAKDPVRMLDNLKLSSDARAKLSGLMGLEAGILAEKASAD